MRSTRDNENTTEKIEDTANQKMEILKIVSTCRGDKKLFRGSSPFLSLRVAFKTFADLRQKDEKSYFDECFFSLFSSFRRVLSLARQSDKNS